MLLSEFCVSGFSFVIISAPLCCHFRAVSPVGIYPNRASVIEHVHPSHVAAQFLHLLSLSLSLFIFISNTTKFKNDYKGDNKLIQIKNRGQRKKSTHRICLFIDIS